MGIRISMYVVLAIVALIIGGCRQSINNDKDPSNDQKTDHSDNSAQSRQHTHNSMDSSHDEGAGNTTSSGRANNPPSRPSATKNRIFVTPLPPLPRLEPGACFVGHGKPVSQKRKLPPFTTMEVLGDINVTIKKGKGPAVLKAPANLLKVIASSVKDGHLEMSYRYCVKLVKRPEVTLFVENIQSVMSRGGARFYAKHQIKEQDIDLEVSGKGGIDFFVKATSISARSHGPAKILLSGNANFMNAKINGGGSIGTKKMVVSELVAEVYGSGTVELLVNDSLSGRISGTGKIRYAGSPQITKKSILGDGRIEPITQ